MTCESLIRIGEVHPEITASAGCTWTPVERRETNIETLRARIRELTPSNQELLEFAAKCRPPAKWWNETKNPFNPEQDSQH